MSNTSNWQPSPDQIEAYRKARGWPSPISEINQRIALHDLTAALAPQERSEGVTVDPTGLAAARLIAEMIENDDDGDEIELRMVSMLVKVMEELSAATPGERGEER
jgi:hypothetical protein